jgi:uncharacterized protein YPO0396
VKRTATLGLALRLATGSLLAAGCGGGDDDDSPAEEEAKTQACDAVADIGEQVQQLQSLTIATVTADKITASFDAMEADVNEIKSALPDLADDLKDELQSATDSFVTELSDLSTTVGKSTSAQEAATQVITAADQVADSYRRAFESVGC